MSLFSFHSNDFIALDLETTGLSPTNDRIVQISLVYFHNGKEKKNYTSYVKTDRKVSKAAYNVNHISPLKLKFAPSEDKVYKEVVKFIDKNKHSTIVAHNASFDSRFLNNTLQRMGYSVDLDYTDTLSLARRNVEGVPNYKLDTLCEYFEIELDHAHDAYSDAKACGELYIKLSGK